VALATVRYTWYHDSVLACICINLSKEIPSQDMVCITVDLPAINYQLLHGIISDLQPDILIWNDDSHELILFELAVCFEENFMSSHNRKHWKYMDLAQITMAQGWNASISLYKLAAEVSLIMTAYTTTNRSLILEPTTINVKLLEDVQNCNSYIIQNMVQKRQL
jgi:hypothetical protein